MIVERYAFMPPDPPNPLERNDIMFKTYDIIYLQNSSKDRIPIIFVNKGTPQVLLYSHGNAEDLGSMIPFIVNLSKKLKMSILAYEYLGYGQCTAHCTTQQDTHCSYQTNMYPSEIGCYQSIKLAYNYLTNKLHYHRSNIILIGQSIGCGPTVELAVQKMVGRVILISPFKSAIKVAYDYWAANPLYWMDIFTNEYKIYKVCSPILFMHGTRDTVIDKYHTDDLCNILKYYYEQNNVKNVYEKYMIEGGNHNDLWTSYENEMLNKIYEFLNKKFDQ